MQTHLLTVNLCGSLPQEIRRSRIYTHRSIRSSTHLVYIRHYSNIHRATRYIISAYEKKNKPISIACYYGSAVMRLRYLGFITFLTRARGRLGERARCQIMERNDRRRRPAGSLRYLEQGSGDTLGNSPGGIDSRVEPAMRLKAVRSGTINLGYYALSLAKSVHATLFHADVSVPFTTRYLRAAFESNVSGETPANRFIQNSRQ